MDGRVYSVGLLEKTIGFLLHKSALVLCSGTALLALSHSITPYKAQPVTNFRFEIGFTDFSPAFAAFEDEYLFNDGNTPIALQAGESDFVFRRHTQKPAAKASVGYPTIPVSVSHTLPDNTFDGEVTLKGISMMASRKPAQRVDSVAADSSGTRSFPASGKQLHVNNEELRFGPLVALVKNSAPAIPETPVTATFAPDLPTPAATKKPANPNVGEYAEHAKMEDASIDTDTFRISGTIELKEGLAFIGAMEVSWVVGEYEFHSGSINTPDATYSIEVDELIGDVVLSLYDTKNELIGEGIVDLANFKPTKSHFQQNVAVYPVNWDYAGKVIPVTSLGFVGANPAVAIKQKAIKDATVELYAFNEATDTNKKGEFSFANWKKTNSRTLALATKKGYRDSVFLLDSNQPATVVMFDDAYMDSFFETLADQGVRGVADQGTIYGEITGVIDRSGYQLKLDKAKPIYFSTGFARTDLQKTTNNGLFSFVGLEDGDYELNIEKDGEVIDQKIVVVEQGKVSPIIVDLKHIKKHIEFYDPMDPNKELTEVHLGFFDGMEKMELDKNGLYSANMKAGNEPAIMDFADQSEINRVFVSRHKGLQKVPLLRDNRLFELAVKNEMSIKDGLLIGFVDSSDFYRVAMVEFTPEKTIYFNEQGQVIDPSKENAFGFIMSGFPQGLNSISIERVADNMILATDFVFSDHEAISIINTQILDL